MKVMVETRLLKYLASEILLGYFLSFSSVEDAVGAPVFHLWSQKIRVEGGRTVDFSSPVSSVFYRVDVKY